MKHTPAITRPIPSGGVGWAAIDQREIDAVTTLLKTPQNLFRYRGKEDTHCSLFEKEVCDKTGIAHAFFVASGTSALTCALTALQVGPGDEVIVPGYTYLATVAAVIEVGAVPVICEIDDSLSLSPEDFERKLTPYTKAVIPVHMQGVPARMDAIWAVARKHGIKVIEDACQAVGSSYKGAFTGARSDAAAWSLNYYKVLTCGEGGVFFAKNEADYVRGVYYADVGTPLWDYDVPGVGIIPPFAKGGCRGNEVNACIARVQLAKLDDILAKTRALKKRLLQCLEPGIHYKLQHVDDPEGECGIACALIAESAEAALRLSEKLRAEGLETAPAYRPGSPDRHIFPFWEGVLSKTGATDKGYPWKDPAYKGAAEYSPGMCPQTLDLLSRSLRIGIHLKMDAANMEEIAAAVNYADRAL